MNRFEISEQGKIIELSFYREKQADILFKELLGKLLCHRTADGVIRRRIIETECYLGETDTACHAHKGRTARTDVMYKSGGVAYVYLCYGIHSLLNIVTGDEGSPQAVLIRGVEGASGPGRVAKAMQISLSDNRLPFTPESGIWLEDDGFRIAEKDIALTPRVGIDYAESRDRERLWRAVLHKCSRN